MDINEIIKTITEQVIAEINKSGGVTASEGNTNYARYIDHTLLKHCTEKTTGIQQSCYLQ